jgi:hypothetical protein
MSEFEAFVVRRHKKIDCAIHLNATPTICSSICPRGQLPKSPASSSLFDASPNICKIAPRLWLGEFAISNAKRLFRQPRPIANSAASFGEVGFFDSSRKFDFLKLI